MTQVWELVLGFVIKMPFSMFPSTRIQEFFLDLGGEVDCGNNRFFTFWFHTFS